MQPIVQVGTVQRFKENKIVSYLLDNGGFDMNKIALLDFDREDRSQFAQLIGYSLSGWGELGYVSDDDYQAACAMTGGLTEEQARIESLEYTLGEIRKHLREATVAAFNIHPDDLQ